MLIPLSWGILAVNIMVMKGILFFFCAFTFFFGAMFLFSPQMLTKMNEWGNKVIFPPVNSVQRNGIFGILLLLLGVVMVIILVKC